MGLTDLHLKQRARVFALAITAGVLGVFTVATFNGTFGSDNGAIRFAGVLLSLVFLQSAAALALAAVFMALRNPLVTRKNLSDGTMPAWSVVVWWPWMLTHIAWLLLKRLEDGDRVPVLTEVAPGLFLGGYPAFIGYDETKQSSPDRCAVDVTCELPAAVAPTGRYLCVPVWDGMAPTPQQLVEAADWIAEQRRDGHSVQVTCFHGVGRSATVMCAALVKCGVAADIDTALATLVRHRPIVKLQDYHLKELREWVQLESARAESGH